MTKPTPLAVEVQRQLHIAEAKMLAIAAKRHARALDDMTKPETAEFLASWDPDCYGDEGDLARNR